jgi:hypothetical protein
VERAFTMRGPRVHDAMEWVFTMAWNRCSRWRGARI